MTIDRKYERVCKKREDQQRQQLERPKGKGQLQAAEGGGVGRALHL
jgi:hypothetical protein